MRTSPLELLLPSGRATRTLVLGSGCPSRLRPAVGGGDGSEVGDGNEPVDLAVVAPTEAECQQVDWLANAAMISGARLAAHGLAYVLVPRRWRSRARRSLRAEGLAVDLAVLHLPDAADSRHMVPLERAPARHAFASVVPLVPWKRIAARTLLALRGAPAVASRVESVALVARRPAARPLLEWLPLPGVADGAPRSAVISSSWRPGGASVVLHPFAAGAEPPVVAKLSLDPDAATDPDREGSRLARLAGAARRAGAHIPEPLDAPRLHGSTVLVETRVQGELLAPLLVRRPAQLGRAVARVCDWLEAWQRLTANATRLTREQLESEVLAHAEFVALRLGGGAEYVAALEARCAAAAGTLVPLTAAHNDLTMWNVLVDRRGRLGIVDWEVAEEATLPLKDFFYAVVDAVAATRGYADRVAAARDCFGGGGQQARTVEALQTRLAGAVGLSREIVELSFHACWVGHAANELRSAGSAEPTPFRDIVQWLAWRDTPSGP